jgi:hypothetical protein
LKSGLPALSVESADRICRALLPLAEDAWTLSGRLSALGFGAHLPWQKFFESFAADDAELEEYRSYRVETAKNVIGRPWPRSMFEREAPYFFSERVKALLEQRDRDNGVDESELSKRYPTGESLWRRELTRCDRRRVQLEMQQRDEYERLRAQAAEASRQVLLTEVEREASGGGSQLRDPVECYAEAMALHAAKLGFQRDAAKSKGTMPVFSKELAGTWDLCWAIEQPQFRAPGWGLFSPALHLRSRLLAGMVDRAPIDSYLTLRVEQVVPEFGRGYMNFSDCASLQTLVLAHLALYELMAPVIEGAIRRNLLH